MIRILNLSEANAFIDGRKQTVDSVGEVVRPILQAVRQEGDAALFRYARKFDGLGDQPVRVPESELRAAFETIPADVKQAAETAARNIREYATRQLPRDRWEEFSPGRKLGWIVRPLDAVGCYVPSGRYPLVSTLLMTAVLAQAAGVPRICIASPKPSTEILGCAQLLG